jgi:hypothetical protein
MAILLSSKICTSVMAGRNKVRLIRESQHVEAVEVRITALSGNLALLTREEGSEMGLKKRTKHAVKNLFLRCSRKKSRMAVRECILTNHGETSSTQGFYSIGITE